MVVLPAAVLTAEESLRGAKMEATTAAAGPKNAVNRASADFNKLLHFVHDHAGVGFNCPFLLILGIVCALTGDINQTVVNDHRHDDVFFAAGLAFRVQLTDGVRILG